jgi:hypothetical protein
MTTASLPIPIESYLDRFASRRRWQRVVRAGGIALVLSVAWMMTWCLMDRLVGLPWLIRAAALVVNVAGVGMIVGRAVQRLVRRRDLVRAAASVERRTSVFSQRLETAVSRTLGPQSWRGSNDLLEALTYDVAAEVDRSDPAQLLPWSPALRPWAVGAIALGLGYLLSLGGWLDLPRLARRYVMPWGNVSEVTTTRLTVRPGNVGVAEGDTLRVRASAVRLGDASPLLNARSLSQSGQGQGGAAWSQQIMSATADGSFEARVRNVDRDVEYFVTGGDASSEVFVARVWHKPAIVRFRVHYNYPAYTSLRARDIESTTGQLEAPIGTEATVAIDTTEALSLAVMTIAGGEPVRFSPGSHPASMNATFVIRNDGPFTIRMASAHGVSGAFRGGTIRALADRKPVVRFRFPPPAQAHGDDAVPITYQAVDDYGIARLEAEVSVRHSKDGGVTQRSVPISIVGTRREHGQFFWELKTIGAAAGDTVEVRLMAEDRAGQAERSETAKVNVVAGVGGATTRPFAATQPMRRAGGSDVGAPLDPPGYAESLRVYFEAIRGEEQE